MKVTKLARLMALALALLLVLGGCSGSSDTASDSPSAGGGAASGDGKTQYISIATSSSGGAFSIIGTAMADIINKNVPGISANIEITGGSSENILLAENKSVELAMTASDVMSLAINGEGSFEGKTVENVLGVMGGHLTTTQVYVLKDSDIHSFDDLKGKKIAVGPAGSVAVDAMKIIMETYGYQINADWSPEYLAHGDGAEALTDGNVDAVVIMSTIPAGPVTTAAASKPIRLLDLEPEKLDYILEQYPFYTKAEIPAGVYTGQEEEVNYTFGSACIMVAHKDLPEEDVYNMLKCLLENNDALVKAYPQCDEWSVENLTRGIDGIIEMHPGAIRYMEENGLL